MKKFKPFLIIMSLAIFTFSLTGCSQSIEHKKDISIKDIINDKKEHFLYTVSNSNVESKVDWIYLTKAGKMKMIAFDDSLEIPPSLISKLDANEVKKTLDSKDVDYDETPYQDVKSYIELTTDNGKPLFTLLTTNNISKKDFQNDIGKAMNQSATDKDSFMFYTSVETGQSQYPTKNVEYIGTFTANPSALRGDDADDDDYKYTMIKLDNKHQKLVDLSPKDKDVTQVKFSDFNME